MNKRKKDIKISDDLLYMDERVELADTLVNSWRLLDMHAESVKAMIEKIERLDVIDLDYVLDLYTEFRRLRMHAMTCTSLTENFLENFRKDEEEDM